MKKTLDQEEDAKANDVDENTYSKAPTIDLSPEEYIASTKRKQSFLWIHSVYWVLLLASRSWQEAFWRIYQKPVPPGFASLSLERALKQKKTPDLEDFFQSCITHITCRPVVVATTGDIAAAVGPVAAAIAPAVAAAVGPAVAAAVGPGFPPSISLSLCTSLALCHEWHVEPMFRRFSIVLSFLNAPLHSALVHHTLVPLSCGSSTYPDKGHPSKYSEKKSQFLYPWRKQCCSCKYS